MMDLLLLNLILFIFLILVFFENSYSSNKLKLKDISSIKKHVSPKEFLLLLLSIVLIILLLLLKGRNNILFLYLYTILSYSILLHSGWLSLKLVRKFRLILFLTAFSVILYRLYFPSYLSHDLFIILSVSWIGPLLELFRFFTKKMFIIISLVWFIYDIFYVYLTSFSQHVLNTTRAVGFPLAILTNNMSLGLADLFYASILVSILKHRKNKVIAIVSLVISNIFLNYYALNTQNIVNFPLLVLWVPIGIILIVIEDKIFPKDLF